VESRANKHGNIIEADDAARAFFWDKVRGSTMCDLLPVRCS
jgi:hypothetical protein